MVALDLELPLRDQNGARTWGTQPCARSSPTAAERVGVALVPSTPSYAKLAIWLLIAEWPVGKPYGGSEHKEDAPQMLPYESGRRVSTKVRIEGWYRY